MVIDPRSGARRWSGAAAGLLLGVAFALLLSAAAATAAGDDPTLAQRVRDLRQTAAQAYRAKDWPGFLQAARTLHDLQPSRPGSLYNLACAEARNGNVREAARLLEDLLNRGIDYGIADSEDFASARQAAEFAPVLRWVEELEKPVGGSVTEFRLPEKDLLTEGIAYDPVSRSFFVSSVHRRKIVRRAADGRVSDFIAEGQDGIDGVLALAVDSKRRLLWACSAAVAPMKGYGPQLAGRTGLFAYDLASGKLVRKLDLTATGKAHELNDLTIADNGDVYTTDSQDGGVYVARLGGSRLEEFLAPGILRSSQGLAFSRDGARLYVADWGEGLFAIDPKTRERHEVMPAPGTTLLGIDGLARYGDDLVVIQNLLHPHRVVRLTLDRSGLQVAHATVLDRADPEFSEPTLGVVVGDSVYVVGKSQWGDLGI